MLCTTVYKAGRFANDIADRMLLACFGWAPSVRAALVALSSTLKCASVLGGFGVSETFEGHTMAIDIAPRAFERAVGPACVRRHMCAAMFCVCMVRSRCEHLGYAIGCATGCLAHFLCIEQHRFVRSRRVRSLFGPFDPYGTAVRPVGNLSLGGCVVLLLFVSAAMCFRHLWLKKKGMCMLVHGIKKGHALFPVRAVVVGGILCDVPASGVAIR